MSKHLFLPAQASAPGWEPSPPGFGGDLAGAGLRRRSGQTPLTQPPRCRANFSATLSQFTTFQKA